MAASSTLRETYERVAGRYDVTTRLFYLLGYRYHAYRRRALRALAPQPGDTVVDLGCGTGVNLVALSRAVGPEGRVVGVDATRGMLRVARRRLERAGCANVELVRGDAAAFAYPERVDGLLATYAISMMPDPPHVITRGARALAPGGRLAVADFRVPAWWPAWVRRLALALSRPLGETEAMAARRLWKPMQRVLAEVHVQHYYFGGAYVACGRSRRS